MLCEFEKLIYPSDAAAAGAAGYMVAVYRPCEKVVDAAGKSVWQIKAVGYNLPVASGLQFDLKGHWSNHSSHGLQYEVEGYKERIVHTKEGIISYLSSGQIKGIGPVMAERIFDAFGMNTLAILDKKPERLLEVKGISKAKLEKITNSYMESRGARDVIAFLTPHGITAKRAIQFYREYGSHAMEVVKSHPYRLCEIDGIGFRIADKIALSMGFSRLSPERVDEGILYMLREQEACGHLCIAKEKFIGECLKTLDTPELTAEMVGVRASKMIYSGRLTIYGNAVYSKKTAEAEVTVARRIRELMAAERVESDDSADQKIREEEKELGIALAEQQIGAVRMALKEGLCIITGGPGTGKTMIQRVILDIYHKQYPEKQIICCAPTGRAARRMEESTGFPASTIHATLCSLAEETDGEEAKRILPADLVLVDEVSMLDIYVAKWLFTSIPEGCRVILVGDADQLPSVGPGAVLSELLASSHIPKVKLDQVFRQKEGSRIAINAQQIRRGQKTLEYGDDFQFISSGDLAESAKIIEKLYLQEAAACGVDHVALLSPFRQKTQTGVNALNTDIRERVNPKERAKSEITFGKNTFRTGDKVMQTKNRSTISNGDIGYIKSITGSGSGAEVTIDFGDHRIIAFEPADLEYLDLGYASTIHKSQGSEYDTVIINIQSAHYIMLNRPLIYTAITRGKKKVILVGEKRALAMAIGKIETEKRGTNLAARIGEYFDKEYAKAS